MNFIFYLIIITIIVVTLYLLLKKKQKPKQESYGVISTTEKGEKVRSKAEKVVADYLFENNINYKYEDTITLGGKHKIKYDFYLPDYDIYIEYWGLQDLDNDTGKEYRARKAEKIELYDKYNLKLISLDENDLPKLDEVLPAQIAKLSNKKPKFNKLSNSLKTLLFGKTTDTKTTDIMPDNEHVFCTSCGKELPPGSDFCVECGTKLN